MRLSARAAIAAMCAMFAMTLTLGCGARTAPRVWDAAPPVPDCITDEDCDDHLYCTGRESCREGRCVPGAPVVCIDGDECTGDDCSEATRTCVHAALSRDADGDGYRAPRDGYRPGAPGACGDDCDDTNRNVHPGATEICNGIDDDCNGVIDDRATFTPTNIDVRVSEPSTAPSGPGGLAWAGERYLSSYWGYTEGTSHVYFSALDRNGMRISTPPQIRITLTPSDAFGAAVAWNGTELGIVWQDRRDGDYEIYFNRLTPYGERLAPDQRVTFARGFSINPSITWTGTEYILAWQDERDTLGSGGYEIYAQRVARDGRQVEDNARITRDPSNSEAPIIVSNARNGLGLVWLDGRGGPMNEPTSSRGIWFAVLSNELQRMSPDLRITRPGESVVAPALTWNRDRWVLAWHDAADASPDHEIWGATRDAGGLEIAAPLRLTNDRGFSRYPTLIPLGDRLMLIWADDRTGPGYEIYARMMTPELTPLTAETRVTMAPRDSVYPVATLGPEGDIGVLYRDQREGRWQVNFTRLQCAIPR